MNRSMASGIANKNYAGAPEGGRQGNHNMLNVLERDPVRNLTSWIRQGKNSVFTVTADVTPAMAKILLENNTGNRPIRWKGPARTVEAYTLAMLRNEWLLNGEPIIVARTGDLNDGQHRLHGVIQADRPVRMQLTFGVERDSRHTVDQGAARSPGNILSMFGEKNSNQLAHALQFLWSYDDHKVFGYRPSPEQLLETLAGNTFEDEGRDIRSAVRAVVPLSSEFRVSVGYIGGAYHVCRRVDEERAQEFIDGLITGLNIADKNSPIIRLRHRFQQHASRKETLPAIEQAALFIKAFNAFRRRKTINNLIWRRNGSAAEDFPIAGV